MKTRFLLVLILIVACFQTYAMVSQTLVSFVDTNGVTVIKSINDPVVVARFEQGRKAILQAEQEQRTVLGYVRSVPFRFTLWTKDTALAIPEFAKEQNFQFTVVALLSGLLGWLLHVYHARHLQRHPPSRPATPNGFTGGLHGVGAH